VRADRRLGKELRAKKAKTQPGTDPPGKKQPGSAESPSDTTIGGE